VGVMAGTSIGFPINHAGQSWKSDGYLGNYEDWYIHFPLLA